MQFTIDPEISNLCRSLTEAEKEGLEQDLRERGCLDSLKLWEGVLIDGHNRHEICARLGIEARCEDVPGIESRQEAINWVISNQLGRRNLSPTEASYLRGKRYNAEKQPHGGQVPKKGGGENPPPMERTRDRLAKEFGVNETTVRKDGDFAAAVDSIAINVGPEIARGIRSGQADLTKTEVREIGKMQPEQQATAIKQAKAKPKRVTVTTLGKITPMERATISDAQKEAGKNFLHALRILNQLTYEPEVLARMKWPGNWRDTINHKLADAHSYLADFAGAWKYKENIE